MGAEPDAGAAAHAITAEVAGLIPARGAAFPFVGHGVRHQSAERQDDERRRDLRQENHDRQNRSGALLEWKQAQNEDRAGTGR